MARPGGPLPLQGQVWAADNGRFGRHAEVYTDANYIAWLERFDRSTCLFATAPDVVGDAARTIALSLPMLKQIRDLGYGVALVAQDGIEDTPVPWDQIDAIFVGGSTPFKLGPIAANVVREAKKRGKWAHMGRVNSLKRMRYASEIGCDSVDGTVLKFDPNRPVKDWLKQIEREKNASEPTRTAADNP